MAGNGITKPRALAIAAGFMAIPSAGLSVAAAHSGFQNRAKETLFRCMERGNFVTLSAIVVQKGRPGCPNVQVKVEQDKGKRKETILQPLSCQGFLSVNDGKKQMFYNPDKQEKMSQPAPSLKEGLKERMALAEQNYKFDMERNGVIAGRPTWVVTATPKFDDLPSRKFSIDVDKDVLLRLETIEDGRKILRFDTQAIWYPENLDADTFVLKPIGEVRIVNVPGPQKITDPSSARAKVGFIPLVPKDLPFGFVVRDSQLTGREEARFVAVRITDGLITATIYQWDPRRMATFGGDLITRTVRGVRIGLVGDLPDIVHEKLLNLFEKEAVRVFGPGPEPPAPMAALRKERKPPTKGAKEPPSDRTEEDSDREPVDERLMETVASFLTMLQNSPELQ